MGSEGDPAATYEYIVVGSGAGGGPLAARLAEAGHTVLLLEAGGDPVRLPEPRLPEDYDVPVFHAFATENDAVKWDYFVRHYGDDEQQRRDPKFVPAQDGVLYPRAGALGGCTAHNALILVYPHNADWDNIARITGDPSWKADKMRQYFERLEDCRQRPLARRLYKVFGCNATRHGFDGWLSTERARPMAVLRDGALTRVILRSAVTAFFGIGRRLRQIGWYLKSWRDFNDWRLVRSNAVGVYYTPLTTRGHVRNGSRERILDVAGRHPDKLRIELDALVTRVLFDGGNRAIGVEYLKGKHLYRAHHDPNGDPGEKRRAFVSRETILCGGAFNTPQLLMLSGIGPRQELERHGIEVQVDLPGVGKNLQDRYEVGVVNRMTKDWKVLAGARFAKGDPQYREWAAAKKGVYITNGGVLGAIKKSKPDRLLPDLFCLGLVGKFQGYFPGYSKLVAEHHDYLSWIVLKAHTINRRGEVRLRSKDPRDRPYINFHYFEEGSDSKGEDLDSVVEGVKFVRTLTAKLKAQKVIAEEELPGDHIQSDDDLRNYIRDHAWGHHASCSCAIGPQEKHGVLTSDFRVHGTQGLRVVDASVFPRIPGFFIVSAVYMVAEKAADVILADAG